MQAFWRYVIGGAMIVFGAIGIISALFLQPERPITDLSASPVPRFAASPASSADVEDTVTDAAAEEAAKQQYESDRSALKEAVAERDVDKCAVISDTRWQVECRDSIYFAMALRDQYIDLCDKIETAEKKRYCRDDLLLATAKADGDFSVCPEIVDKALRTQCLEEETRATVVDVKSIEDCERIKDQEERQLCYDYFATQAAKTAADPKITDCEKVVDPSQKSECRQVVAVGQAEQQNDPAVCRQLIDAAEVKACLESLNQEFEINRMASVIEAGDPDRCAVLTDAAERGYCEDQALLVKAIDNHDPQLCQKIHNGSSRERCDREARAASNRYFSDLALKEKDPKWCSLLVPETSAEACEQMLDSRIRAAE
jgi:hypothetical protein